MQKTIMRIVLIGLLASVVFGCDKKTETSQLSDTSETAKSQQSELSKVEKKFISSMEDNKNFTDNKRCYWEVPKAQQEKADVDSIATIILLLSYKLENKQSNISANHIEHMIKQALKRGCNPNEISRGFTPLVQMLIVNSHDSIRLLLDNGADPMLTTQSTDSNIKGKNLFEISAFFRTYDKSAERAKTDDLVQSYKAQFEK